MRILIAAALAAATMVGPALAQADPSERREWRDDRRDFQRDRRDFQQDRRAYERGDISRREFREERREFQDDRRDFRDDRRDWREARRDGAYHNGQGWRDGRYHGAWNGHRYYHPRGYDYRSWGVGYRLPRAYWGDPYWISRPYDYRLFSPYRGTRWVRVGPDALLINVHTGRIVQVVRSRFY